MEQSDEMLLMGLRLKEGIDLSRYEALWARLYHNASSIF